MQPTNLFGDSCAEIDKIIIKNYSFIEDNGTYKATEISFSHMVSGIYYFVFLVDGIESRRSEEIIISVSQSRDSIFSETFEIVWSSFTIFAIIFVNSPYLNKFTLTIPILMVILEIVVIQQSNKGIAFQITSIVILSVILLLNIATFKGEFGQNINPNFAITKEKAFRAYTELKLFGYIAETNMDPKNQLRLFNRQYYHLPLNLNVQPFKKANLFQRIQTLFKPFNLNNALPDCFYFPQRLIAAIFMNLFAYIYLTINIAFYVFQLIDRYAFLY